MAEPLPVSSEFASRRESGETDTSEVASLRTRMNMVLNLSGTVDGEDLKRLDKLNADVRAAKKAHPRSFGEEADYLAAVAAIEELRRKVDRQNPDK